MKWLLKIFRGPIKKILIRELEKQSTKELVITTINTKLDIPKLDEIEEAKLFTEIYNASTEALTIAIDRI